LTTERCTLRLQPATATQPQKRPDSYQKLALYI